ncbi:hypothetical protein BDV96DRAFT_637662 [Lophiotrema nucula]|uniref:Uncharacterized protein n=1 Tax=Lophiotrema nucula TaxID=690887 RepID=A0A6A5YM84_9PLEO|nr:hypothetical protein BDV96DRAFT_637662 [Lophiotrema nucula]
MSTGTSVVDIPLADFAASPASTTPPHLRPQSRDRPESIDTVPSRPRAGSQDSTVSKFSATDVTVPSNPGQRSSSSFTQPTTTSADGAISVPAVLSLGWFGKVCKFLWSKVLTMKILAISAFIIATIVVYPTFKSEKLSKWTAKKDYLEHCQAFKETLAPEERSRCEAAINQGLPPPPGLLRRNSYIELSVRVIWDRRPSSLLSRSSSELGTDKAQLDDSTSETERPSPDYTSDTVVAEFMFASIVYYVLILVTVLAARRAKQSILKWFIFQRLGLYRELAWTAIFWLAFSMSILLPVSYSISKFYQYEKDRATALKAYIEYCSHLHVEPGNKSYDNCQSAGRELKIKDEMNTATVLSVIYFGAIVSLISVVLSAANLRKTLKAFWNRRNYRLLRVQNDTFEDDMSLRRHQLLVESVDFGEAD